MRIKMCKRQFIGDFVVHRHKRLAAADRWGHQSECGDLAAP